MGTLRVTLRNYWRDLSINSFTMSHAVPIRARRTLLRACGLKIGAGANLLPGSWFGSKRVAIGAGTFIGRGCYFDALDQITIGARCDLAAEVAIITSSHEIAGPGRRAGASIRRPVVIGDGAWIGARATILPGVTISPGAVVAAGALVTKDVPANCLVAGSPAKPVRELATAINGGN